MGVCLCTGVSTRRSSLPPIVSCPHFARQPQADKTRRCAAREGWSDRGILGGGGSGPAFFFCLLLAFSLPGVLVICCLLLPVPLLFSFLSSGSLTYFSYWRVWTLVWFGCFTETFGKVLHWPGRKMHENTIEDSTESNKDTLNGPTDHLFARKLKALVVVVGSLKPQR